MRARASSGLARFLTPRSIAIVGASPERRKIRGALLHLLRKNGYRGEIYPVNPTHAEIDGLRCYPSAAAIGRKVDLGLIAIPAACVLPALKECAAAGMRNAIVISSGFADGEAAHPDLQGRITAIARQSGMRICGPNSEGFHNEVEGVTATFSPAVESIEACRFVTPKRVGVIAQSGGIGFALYNRGRALGLSFSVVTSTGNEADLTAADFFEHMACDPGTEGVLLFLESIRDLARFRAAAEACAVARKPVVAIKVGRSGAGRQAAASHTASLAGWDKGYDALFRHHGIVVASDLDEALSVMAALLTNPSARGNRVAILTLSGGAGALAADALTSAGLDVVELPSATQARIGRLIPSFGSTRNPVDLTAQAAHDGGLLRTAELLLEDDAIDMIAIICSLASPTRVTLDGSRLGELVGRWRKPVLVHSYTLPSEFGLRCMAEAGVAIMGSLALLGAAGRALLPSSRPGSAPSTAGVLPRAVAGRLGSPGALTEHAAKRLLERCGIAVSPSRLVTALGELEGAAAELDFPLAMKVQSPDITHKTEVHGVRLGIADCAALREAYRCVLEAARRHAPDARIEGVLLERMAPPGTEIIVGVVRDAAVGPVVTVGAGGIAAELYGDSAHRLAPVDEIEARSMLAELRAAPLLDGYRGAPAADLAALAQLVAQLSQLAVAGAELIAEIELNPVIVHQVGQGCTIADALLVVGPSIGPTEPEGA